jgi:hypothetical protein
MGNVVDSRLLDGGALGFVVRPGSLLTVLVAVERKLAL